MKKITFLALASAFLAFNNPLFALTEVSITAEELETTFPTVKSGETVKLQITTANPKVENLMENLKDYKIILDLTECTSLKEIPEKAFYERENLEQVILPTSVTKIGKNAFYKTSIKEIDLTNITSIENFAFKQSKLKEISIPEMLTEIGVSAFADIETLENINVNEKNKNYVSENGILFSKDKKKIISYPIAKNENEYTIPSTVEIIASSTFEGNKKISKVNLPEKLKLIGGFAFANCSSIKEITIPATVTYIGQNAFNGTSIKEITIPKAVTEIGINPFGECKSLNAITVEEGNTKYSSVDGVLFETNEAILKYPVAKTGNEYTIPENIKKINSYAFDNTKITKVNFTNIETIEKYAFKNCKSIKTIELPNGIKKIGRQAFYGCKITNLPEYYVGTADSFPTENKTEEVNTEKNTEPAK